MSAERFLDTNILLYAYDLDSGEKREIALEILSAAFARPTATAMSVQVFQEFHVNFIKSGHSQEKADVLIQDFSHFNIIDNTLTLFKEGLTLQKRWQLSLWNAMILAAARQSGAQELYSEDFNSGQNYGGIVAINPFQKKQL